MRSAVFASHQGLSLLTDYLTLADYDAAEKESTDRIIKRQSRGSIFAQNGWSLTAKALAKKSRAADQRMRNLRKALEQAKL